MCGWMERPGSRRLKELRLETDPHIAQMDSRSLQWGKNNYFNRWCYDDQHAPCNEMKLDVYLTPYTKTDLK